MPVDDLEAYESAVSLVGVTVWEKLSDVTRAKMLDEELARLSAEQLEPPGVTLT